MVESIQSAIVLAVIAFMVGIVSWVSLTNYKQMNLRDAVLLRAWQPSKESVEIAEPAVLGDRVSNEGRPVEYVGDYPAVQLPPGAQSIFAP